MRILLVVVGLLLSAVAAHAERVIPSGKQLILFNATSVNPDCSALGNVEVRVAQGPEHGKVSIRRTRVFLTYVSQRGYVGDDLVVIEVFFPNGRAQRTTIAIRVV